MPLSLTELKTDLYKVFDQIIETGIPVSLNILTQNIFPCKVSFLSINYDVNEWGLGWQRQHQIQNN